jgi:hypothetical protein
MWLNSRAGVATVLMPHRFSGRSCGTILHGEVSTQIGVSRVTGIARATVLRRMHELDKAGKLVREDRGYYISGSALSACLKSEGLERSIDLIEGAAAGLLRLRGANERHSRVVARARS